VTRLPRWTAANNETNVSRESMWTPSFDDCRNSGDAGARRLLQPRRVVLQHEMCTEIVDMRAPLITVPEVEARSATKYERRPCVSTLWFFFLTRYAHISRTAARSSDDVRSSAREMSRGASDVLAVTRRYQLAANPNQRKRHCFNALLWIAERWKVQPERRRSTITPADLLRQPRPERPLTDAVRHVFDRFAAQCAFDVLGAIQTAPSWHDRRTFHKV